MLGEDVHQFQRFWDEVLIAQAKGRGLKGSTLKTAREICRDAYLIGAQRARNEAHKHHVN